MFTPETFKDWITQAEAAWGKVKSEYESAREYYETEQEPSGVPSSKEYVIDDIITDTIDRSVGQMISGEIRPVLTGGGPLAKPAKELHNDILEANDFKESILPEQSNYFYCEGLGGLKFIDNPNKKGKYGIGFPEIYGLMPGELLLDPNARNGMHTDDIFRIHFKKMRLDEALEKWGKNEKGRKTKLWEEITQSAETEGGQNTVEPKFCDVYEIEFKIPEFKNIVRNVNGLDQNIRIQEDVYYITKLVNKIVEVEKPRKTGYPCFRIIPMVHTPRIGVNFGRYPFALYKKLGQTQDHLNVTASILHEAVKAQIKQLIVGQGLKQDEEVTLKIEASKTNGVFIARSPQAKVNVIVGTPLPPSLTEYYTMRRQAYDDIKGSSNQAQQFQSAAAGQLSGRAIGSLAFAGTLPEYTKKANIEFALKQLSECIFYYIKHKMLQPFSIERTIDGQNKSIRFNAQAPENFQPNEMENTNEMMVINDLSMLGESDVKIEIEMNVIQKQEIEMNKALILAQAQKIADKDLFKKLYPSEWREMYENYVAQGGAMALVNKMASYGQDFVNLMGGLIDQYAQQFNVKAEKKGQLV